MQVDSIRANTEHMTSETVIHHLKIVPRPSKPQQAENPIYVGRRYSLAEGLAIAQTRAVCADQDLFIGGYRLARDRAEIIAADPEHEPERLFVWNGDADNRAMQDILAVAAHTDIPASRHPLVANRLQLNAATLSGPDLQDCGTDARLNLTANFELEWHTDICPAELGAVELVQATRSIRFEDGSEQVLIDTSECEGGVRYYHAEKDGVPVTPIGERQSQGASIPYRYQVELTQHIPSHLDGKAVADVTVLEKYTSYFMQCEDPADTDNHIWVPLLSPVMWGWSIRVGRRTDGEWGILRRKLFMPTGMDEGLLLPLWQTSSQRLLHK